MKWIKASERLPEKLTRKIHVKIDSEPHVMMDYDFNNLNLHREGTGDLQWLDESAELSQPEKHSETNTAERFLESKGMTVNSQKDFQLAKFFCEFSAQQNHTLHSEIASLKSKVKKAKELLKKYVDQNRISRDHKVPVIDRNIFIETVEFLESKK